MTFEEAWAEKENAGYQYGEDALEQVRFGWEIAQAAFKDAFKEEAAAAIRNQAQVSEPGQIVSGRARDGMVYLTIEFPGHIRLPGVGAAVRIMRAEPKP